MAAQNTLSKGWESDSSNDHSSRNITVAYILALLLIAFLSASMHYLLNRGMSQEEDAATVVNVAGRQRMLSQRIALLSQDVEAGFDSARTALTDDINLMERSQDALVKRNDLGISSALSSVASSYYFGGPAPLDGAVRKFVSDARQFLKMAPGSDRHKIQTSIHQTALDRLLPALDRAVSIFEGEANERVASTLLMQNIVFTSLLLTLVAEAFLIFRPVISTVKDHANRLYILATHDSLTNLPNHRFFIDTSDRLIRLARRGASHNLAALVIDIDRFKQINDTSGHATGDAVLIRFANIIRNTLRVTDVFGRIGGEEFAVVLPDTDLAAALFVAERLRKAVENDRVEDSPPFTISIGVTPLMPADISVDSLLQRSDEAMYFAKKEGRNRVGFISISAVHPMIYDLCGAIDPCVENRKVA